MVVFEFYSCQVLPSVPPEGRQKHKNNQRDVEVTTEGRNKRLKKKEPRRKAEKFEMHASGSGT